MKFKKIVSVVLAMSMMAAFAGCSKVKSISGEDFVKACENMGAEEVDPEDSNDVDEDDYENGVYMILDQDYIEEHMSDADTSAGMYGIDTPDFSAVINTDDIEEMTVFVKADQNIDHINSADDIEDLEMDAVAAVQITLSEDDLAEDIMANLADSIDEYLGIDVEDLSSNEYYTGKNQGYLKVHVDAEDIVAAFLDSDIYDLISAFSEDSDEIEEQLESMTGGVSTAFYINGENIVILIGVNVTEDNALLSDFCSELGVADPSKLPSNPEVAEGIINYVDDTFGSLISTYSSYATSYDF